MPRKTRLDWRQAVKWRRGPLSTLHAEWRRDSEGYATCSPTPLSGPDEGYHYEACPRCVDMARSAYATEREWAGRTAARGPHGKPLSGKALRLRDLHPAVEVSVAVLRTWWPDMREDAAQKHLSRAHARGWL